ncbi:MAG: hypothetical protein M3P06_24475 [Acidobacteriota bacterium]|nr:hypothetical protein [Acidobacteriota bacterium]
MPNQKRITLIARGPTKPDVDWNYPGCNNAHVAFVDSLNALKFAVRTTLHPDGLNIERVIIDRAGTAEDFLSLLADLPIELTGDVLMIRDDGTGFLSATGRGGDRRLHTLKYSDVRFYLETQNLVTGRAALALTA